MQTPGVAQCLKLISRKGSEKIIRLAFEFARAEGRKSVACATKANIMKLTEGMFKRTFEEIALEYPDIESWHVIVDNCAHQLVKRPEQFDVIVTTNMNGDILSDLTSALVGGLGFAPSANLGSDIAIFEAVHGSAPKYAGKNTINPTAEISTAVMMLRHLGHVRAGRPRSRTRCWRRWSRAPPPATSRVTTAAPRRPPSSPTRSSPTSAAGGSRGRSATYRPIKMPKVDRAIPWSSARRRGASSALDVFVEWDGDAVTLGELVHRAGRRLAAGAEDGRQPRHGRLSADRHADRRVDAWRCRFCRPRRRRSWPIPS